MSDAMTLFGDEPIIIAGETDSGRRWVQFWGERAVVGIRSMMCAVSMDTADVGTRQFAIHHHCPDAWMQNAWETFKGFREGVMPVPTHAVEWTFGKPMFTQLAATK